MPNSEIRECTANLVAENLFAQCDEDGNYRILFDEIIDYKHDETAIPIGKDTYFDKRHGKDLPTSIQNFKDEFCAPVGRMIASAGCLSSTCMNLKFKKPLNMPSSTSSLNGLPNGGLMMPSKLRKQPFLRSKVAIGHAQKIWHSTT